MKQCPYCAKQIQEEAVVCPYCERALESPQVAETKEASRAVASMQPPIWRQGTIGAAAFTILIIFAAILQPSDSIVLAKKIVFVMPIYFLFFWLVCTFIAWAWRQAVKPPISKTEPLSKETAVK